VYKRENSPNGRKSSALRGSQREKLSPAMKEIVVVQEMPPFSVHLLGPCEVRIEGEPLPRLRSRKVLWLLALLALRQGRAAERSWLVATLWPESMETQAMYNLRQALTDLRRALGAQSERLQSPDRHTLLLDLSAADVDLIAFDSLIKNGDITALEQAVGLYRGPLLEGCTEEWVVSERAFREQAYLNALERLAEQELAAGDAANAILSLRRLLIVDPLAERASRLLMQALADLGDQAGLIQAYREIRLLLRSELQAEPAPETTALYRQLRRKAQEIPPGTILPRAPARRPTPRLFHPLTEMVGRDEQISEIAKRLRRRRLVTLTGPGGIGKTRLAIAVAEELTDEYPDGVWLVRLDSLSEPKLTARTIATALGLRDEPGRAVETTLTDYLQNRIALLVLDNCEHLLTAAAANAEELLHRCGGLRILATSREALHVAGEQVWPVPPLSFPVPERLSNDQKGEPEILWKFDSMRLFAERLREQQPDLRFDRETALAAARVCHQMDGMPLALELAAALGSSLTVTQIAERLSERFPPPSEGSNSGVVRHRTLQAVIDWSYDQLTGQEQRLFRSLSVFSGGWTQDTAECVCTGADLATSEIGDLLRCLQNKSLIAASGETERRRQLETIRQYAAERLQEAGEDPQGRRCHLDYFLKLAEEAEPKLTGADQAEWLQRLEAEHGNFRSALDFSLRSGEAALALRLCGALQRFWWMRGYLTEGRDWCERSLGLAGAASLPHERAKALNAAGAIAYYQGDYPAAYAYHETSLSFRREIGDRRSIAESLNNLGNVATAQSEYARATAFHRESLTLKREVGDRWGITASLTNLGNASYFQGDYPIALAHYAESLAIQRELGYCQGVTVTLNNLGMVAFAQGDYDSANVAYQESLALCRESDDSRGIARALNNLGRVLQIQGAFAAALSCHEEALPLCRSIGDRRAIAATLLNLGFLAYSQGDYASARSDYEESLNIVEAIGDRQGGATSLFYLGCVAAELGDIDGAAQRHFDSLTIRREIGDRQGLANSLEAIAGLATRLQRPTEGASHLGAAERLREDLGASLEPIERARVEQLIAVLKEALGEETFTRAWAAGRAVSLDEAIVQALVVLPAHAVACSRLQRTI
jgi:predicted ATPase/DNA-binding SARP family transcriptional activator/Tfp pilus assembly protein PilF